MRKLLEKNLDNVPFKSILPTLNFITGLHEADVVNDFSQFNFENYLEIIQCFRLDSYYINNLLNCMSVFIHFHAENSKIRRFIQHAISVISCKNYLSPDNSINALYFFVEFADRYQLDNQIGLRIIQNIPLRFAALTPVQKEKVNVIFAALGESDLAKELNWQLGLKQKVLVSDRNEGTQCNSTSAQNVSDFAINWLKRFERKIPANNANSLSISIPHEFRTFIKLG